jgi:hypothetical protein
MTTEARTPNIRAIDQRDIAHLAPRCEARSVLPGEPNTTQRPSLERDDRSLAGRDGAL